MGLVTLPHAGSSWTRDWTCVSCTGRQILYHWATRDALYSTFICQICAVNRHHLRLGEGWILGSYRQWHPTPVLLPGKFHGRRSLVGCSPWRCEESDITFTFHFHVLKKYMATHSSTLAWKIPGTEEPGGLPSMELHRIGHNWSDLAAAAYMSIPIFQFTPPSHYLLTYMFFCLFVWSYFWNWLTGWFEMEIGHERGNK